MGGIIAIADQKRGVGETITLVDLAAPLRMLEEEVLLIDAGPQANATSGSGINVGSIGYGAYGLLEHTMDVKDMTIHTSSPNLDLIVAHISLVIIGIELVDKQERKYIFKKALAPTRNQYDYILIDCTPSLGLITPNAPTAINLVIIPIQCKYSVLGGLSKLLSTIKSVQKPLSFSLGIEGLLLIVYNAHLRLPNQVVREMQKHFSSMVFKVIIQCNIRLSEAPSLDETIINYGATSRGATNRISLAQEIIDKNKAA